MVRLPRDSGVMTLTTHCLTVFVALAEDGRPRAIPTWEPASEEDVALDAHARELVDLREGRGPGADA